MRGGPEDAGPEVQIAVANNGHGQSACTLISKGDANSGLRVVSNAESAAVTVLEMVLVEVQQQALPIAGELVSGTDAPVVVLNLRAQFRNHALNTDRTHVPSEARLLNLLHALFPMRCGNLRTTRIERSPLLGSDQPPDFFDERR